MKVLAEGSIFINLNQVNRDHPSATEPIFAAKGLVYQGARDFYNKSVPGGWLAVLERLRLTAAQHLSFLEQSFVAGTWYDVLPILPLSLAASQLRGITHAQLVRENAAWLADRDLHSVYRFMLSLTSVELVASRLPQLSLRYFNFGQADGTIIAPRHLQSFRRGIPLAMANWFVAATEGFTPVALKLAGAKCVRVKADSPKVDGTLNGLAVATVRIDVLWDET